MARLPSRLRGEDGNAVERRVLSRRDLLSHGARVLLGTPLVLEGLGMTRFLPEFTARNAHALEEILALGEDSSTLVANALRGGAALARFGMAEAQGLKEDWTVVTIKVFDQVEVGMLFALGKMQGNDVATAALAPAAGEVEAGKHPIFSGVKVGSVDALTETGASDAEKATNKQAVLDYCTGQSGGRDMRKLSTNARLKALRFNDWFGNILATGTTDVDYKLPAGTTGPLPETVAVQVALNLRRPQQGVNHQLNCVFLDEQGDLGAFLEQEGIVFSPLGYTTFMSGDRYDANNWPEESNHVYKRTPGSRAAVPVSRGLSVSQFTANFDRLIRRPGFVDLSKGDANLLVTLDRFVDADPRKRKQFIERRAALVDSLSGIADLGAFEREKVTAAERNQKFAIQGGGRFITPTTPGGATQIPASDAASKDFLAQCLFVARALEFPDAPLRNFNLFLNLADLDGNGLVSVRNGDAPKPRSYNYIEGMRQLGVGLNLLAKASANKKVLINVVTDATRTSGNGDGDVALAMLLGPRAGGMLDDALYCASLCLQGEYRVADASEPNAKSNLRHYANHPQEWDGESAKAFAGYPSLSNWQYGIADFLIDRTGRVDARAHLISPVKLKRKA